MSDVIATRTPPSFRNNAAFQISSVASPFLSGLTLTFLFGNLVPIAVGLILGHSRVGQRFVEVSTAE